MRKSLIIKKKWRGKRDVSYPPLSDCLCSNPRLKIVVGYYLWLPTPKISDCILFLFLLSSGRWKNGKKRRTAGETRVPLHLDCFMLKIRIYAAQKFQCHLTSIIIHFQRHSGVVFTAQRGWVKIQNLGWRKKPEHRFHFSIGSLKMVLPGLIHNSMRQKWKKACPNYVF